MKFVCVHCKKLQLFQVYRNSNNEKGGVFYWSGCLHQYCVPCVISLVTISLTRQNQVPKCVLSHCQRVLRAHHLCSVPEPARKWYYKNNKTNLYHIEIAPLWAKLLSKYDVESAHPSDAKHVALINGFARNVGAVIPNELNLNVIDWYELSFTTTVACDCGGPKRDEKVCSKCKGTGLRVLHCRACGGKGYVSTNCSHCSGTGQRRVFDFRKLCEHQTLCVICKEYCSDDKMFFMSGCRHAFCYACGSKRIARYISNRDRYQTYSQPELPPCPAQATGCIELMDIALFRRMFMKPTNTHRACSCEEHTYDAVVKPEIMRGSNHDAVMQPGLNDVFETVRKFWRERANKPCPACGHWFKNEKCNFFEWTSCRHVYCLDDAAGHISNCLRDGAFPRCTRITARKSRPGKSDKTKLCGEVLNPEDAACLLGHGHPFDPPQQLASCQITPVKLQQLKQLATAECARKESKCILM